MKAERPGVVLDGNCCRHRQRIYLPALAESAAPQFNVLISGVQQREGCSEWPQGGWASFECDFAITFIISNFNQIPGKNFVIISAIVSANTLNVICLTVH